MQNATTTSKRCIHVWLDIRHNTADSEKDKMSKTELF